jgi:hypothetical protein
MQFSIILTKLHHGNEKFPNDLTASFVLCFNTIALRNGPVRPEGRGGSVSCNLRKNTEPSTLRGEGFFMGF